MLGPLEPVSGKREWKADIYARQGLVNGCNLGWHRRVEAVPGCCSSAYRRNVERRQRRCRNPKVVRAFAKWAPQLIVLEATGGHEYSAAYTLMKAGLRVAVVNPRQVPDFARAVGKLAKADPIDAKILAHLGEAVQPPARAVPDRR